ncbi:MAG TPA: hypothetical protein DD405_07940 [Desulfobacteraceae bacterium]|nr:hypothetical protein [Desulfobacteraceae bacterium]
MKNLIFIIPFVFVSFFSNGQITREQAINIMINDVVGSDSLEFHHLYSKYDQLNLNDTLWLEYNMDSIPAPYENNWVFFIDLMPIANWAHPCQIYFLDISNGDFIYYDEMWPPYPYLYNINDFFDEWEWITSVGINNSTSDNQGNFIISPNPFCNEINIEYANMPSKSITINLFNDLGEKIKTINHLAYSSGNGKVNIDTQNLKSGVFIVQIIKDYKIVYLEKIIKKTLD